MFRITKDPSLGSDKLYLTEIAYNGSNVLLMCMIGVWRHVLDCNRKGELLDASINTPFLLQSRTCCQKPTTHIISAYEPSFVISIMYSLSLPDDGSYVIRNMLE